MGVAEVKISIVCMKTLRIVIVMGRTAVTRKIP